MFGRLCIALLFVIAGGIAGRLLTSDLRGSQTAERAVESVADQVIVTAALSPEEVVKLQVGASRRALGDPEYWKTAFAFASPANREVTGPLDRFATMCTSPPYDLMMQSDEWLVGTAKIEDDLAYVLVTVAAKDGVALFGFCLRKQDEQPYQDCWMTESVQQLPIEMQDGDLLDATAQESEVAK